MTLLWVLVFTSCNSTSDKNEPVKTNSDNQAVISSSASNEHNFPDLNKEFGGHDSCEGFNRSMFAVNKYGGRYVMQPLAVFWGSLIPRHVVDCFNRFTDNIAFPKRTFSSLCQAKFKGAGIDFSRFLINVTAGVAGFYDPATCWFDLEYQDEDFGQAFAVWGMGPGATLHLPSIGPTNLRDGTGKIFDYAFDPKTYITGGQGFAMLNEGTSRYRDFDNFLLSYNDPYELAKRLYCAERYVKINDYDYKAKMGAYQQQLMSDANNIPGDINPVNPEDPRLPQIVVSGFKSQGSAIDTIRTGMVKIQNDRESMWVDVSFWNTDFFNRGSIRSVSVIKNNPDLEYKAWCQKDKTAPLAIIIPGSGGHFTGTDVTRLAEIMYDNGYTAVVMSSAMNWSFMVSAAATPVPGYTPVDAEDVRNAIAAIIKDLETNKDFKFQAKLLAGYSLGGLHAAFVGALEKKQPKLKIDRYVAINPPVNLLHAMNQVDEAGQAWKKWQRGMVFERGTLAATKFMGISSKQYKPFEAPQTAFNADPKKTAGGDAKTAVADEKKKEVAKNGSEESSDLPFTNTEAQVLIGYTFKVVLNEMVLTIVRTHPETKLENIKCSWGSRTDFYRAINDMTFMDYVKTFVVKYYSEKENHQMTLAELNDNASLPAIADYLREDKNVQVIHSGNDFLESAVDRQWLQSTMAGRCVFYNAGGHIGDLYFKAVQDRFAQIAVDLKKETVKPAGK